jgi:transcriptional regulator with XRE-family HTH domain
LVNLNYIEIGKRIRSKRKELGLTQKELGAKVNLSEASVSKYESGKVEDASTAKLNEFAEVLGVDIGWLLGIENTKNERETTLPTTIAAHFEGEEFTEEELEEINNYIKFVISKRKK